MIVFLIRNSHLAIENRRFYQKAFFLNNKNNKKTGMTYKKSRTIKKNLTINHWVFFI